MRQEEQLANLSICINVHCSRYFQNLVTILKIYLCFLFSLGKYICRYMAAWTLLHNFLYSECEGPNYMTVLPCFMKRMYSSHVPKPSIVCFQAGVGRSHTAHNKKGRFLAPRFMA